jgi:HlyD family secretion protein
MQRPNDRRALSRVGSVILGLLTMSLIVGGIAFAWSRWNSRKPPQERYAVTDVRRADLHPIVRAGGRIESARRTIIECQLENISVGVQGNRLAAGGASVLLKLIPEGTLVKQGDVLAELDSSSYTELLRVQQMNLERAQADKLQAELDHEIAKLALVEYRDGTLKEATEDFQRRVVLARSDLERARDRLNWTHAMKGKGYVSAGTVANDEYTVAQLELTLQREEGALEVFRKFTVPKAMREFQGEIIGTAATLDYQKLRTDRQRERLEKLRRQVELCTIRAPHDGFVIYASDPRRQIIVEEGIPVRQHQQLFYLPDLSDMEVVALLNESNVNDVRAGMRVEVEVEGMPNQFMKGRVTKVAQLALPMWWTDVRYFEGTIKLEAPVPGLKPGMTAQVAVEMPERENVLAVPSEAVTSDDGQNVCFVIRGDDLERREVKLGQVTREMAEVTDGLNEGEQVVLNPHPAEIEEEDAPDAAPVAPSAPASSGNSSTSDVAALR